MIEMWDIYDADKRRTGRTMQRNDWCLKEGEYHLTVLGVVARPDGKFLITRRVMTKAWAPGWWEVPGGAARAGEDSLEAVLREIQEETGTVVICLVTSGKIQVRETIILWMFIALSLIFRSRNSVYRQRRQTDISLLLMRRFRRLQSREFFCIITV